MELAVSGKFQPLSVDEMRSIDGGWGWKETLMVAGAAVAVASVVVLTLAAPPVGVIAATQTVNGVTSATAIVTAARIGSAAGSFTFGAAAAW